jgi:cytoskeletal protein CcmA (bactofilin family)
MGQPRTNKGRRQPLTAEHGRRLHLRRPSYPIVQTRFRLNCLPTSKRTSGLYSELGQKSVDDHRGVLIITEDTVIRGVSELRNCRQLEVHGYIEGDVAAGSVLVHKTGRLFGKVKTDTAEVHGTLQGDVVVKNLIDIRSSGNVSGNVKYGRLALEMGGNLSAEMRNVPPSLGGDLNLEVGKGRSVPITLQDLTALDPDDAAKDLKFTVMKASNGFVALATAPKRAVSTFTQADLEAGRVAFMHDGTNGTVASFDVVVADHAGATSGAPRTVTVAVRG